jgi:hypothetical protein
VTFPLALSESLDVFPLFDFTRKLVDCLFQMALDELCEKVEGRFFSVSVALPSNRRLLAELEDRALVLNFVLQKCNLRL